MTGVTGEESALSSGVKRRQWRRGGEEAKKASAYRSGSGIGISSAYQRKWQRVAKMAKLATAASVISAYGNDENHHLMAAAYQRRK